MKIVQTFDQEHADLEEPFMDHQVLRALLERVLATVPNDLFVTGMVHQHRVAPVEDQMTMVGIHHPDIIASDQGLVHIHALVLVDGQLTDRAQPHFPGC